MPSKTKKYSRPNQINATLMDTNSIYSRVETADHWKCYYLVISQKDKEEIIN